MNKEIKQYIEEFESVYNGEPFYGKPLMGVVENADPAVVYDKPGDAGHSAYEITYHLFAWRELLVKRLNGDTTASIDTDSKEDWPPLPKEKTGKIWQELVHKLEMNQQDLIRALSKKTDHELDQKFGGSGYTLRALLNGQVQHDIYHIGQISLALKNSTVARRPVAPLM